MFIKLGIIGAILIIGGLVFSSEINELFPKTSSTITESLKDDVNGISVKASESVENRLDSSIDKIVDTTNEKINEGINSAKESSNDLVSNKISKINPIETIESLFKNQPTQ